MRNFAAAGGFLLVLTSLLTAAEPERAVLAAKAQAVLKTHCYRCHGQDGAVEGGMNFILDPGKLIARRKIVPGQPDQSIIVKRIVNGTMPPPEESTRPSADELAALKAWIAAGATVPPPPERARLSHTDMLQLILSDLERFDRRARRFQRYFTLAHLHNAGLSADELTTYRHALDKLVNSLSWHPKLTRTQPVDPAGLVLRIDLRDFLWDASLWNRVLTDYPYGLIDDSALMRAISVSTLTRMPLLRADWFLATASRPPLYHDLLQLPSGLAELERQLRVDANLNIQQERVKRAGFNGSGVSKNNRLLERHDSIHGAYWRSYDFDAVPQDLVSRGGQPPDPRNLFAYPLGPNAAGDKSFNHVGGEMIFSLPNGLHGYFLADKNGNRIDKGPIAIVSDPRRPDRAVEPCVSCMSCHRTGILPKSDQIRDFAHKNPKAFTRSEREMIDALFTPEADMRKAMDEDASRYLKALEAIGVKNRSSEPVSTMVLRYEQDLDLPLAAAELSVPPEKLQQAVSGSDLLSRNLGGLRVAGGTVSRQLWVQTFADTVRELRLGLVLSPPNGANLPDNTGELDPLEGASSQANAMVFTANGKLAYFANADRSVRAWDVEGGREKRLFVGHSASVWSVALSRDGTRVVSGGMDGTARIWDTSNGRELHKLDGHLSLVSAVAISPDGKRVLTGGYDHSLVLWDLDSGEEIRRWDNAFKYVHAVAFSPDGQKALIAADRELHLWSLSDAKDRQRLTGHTSAVTCVAVLSDGQRALTGSDDGTARLWDLTHGKELQAFRGHEGPIRSVDLTPDGRWALTGSADRTVRLWRTADGQELGRFTKHTEPIVRVAFLGGDRQTLSGDRASGLRDWSLAKFRTATSSPVSLPEKTPDPEAPAKIVPPRTLQPLAVLPIDGTLNGLTLSPNGRWLFALNRSDEQLIQIEASTLKPTREWKTAAEVMHLSPDGKTLVVADPTRGSGGKPALVLLDPIELKPRQLLTVPTMPYDVALRNDGLLLASSGGRAWADVLAIDTKKKEMVGRWSGFWGRSLLRLSPDGSRLFVASQGVSPGKLEVASLSTISDEKPTVTAFPATADHPWQGELAVTPDQRFVLSHSGTVLRLAAGKDDDLRPVAKLEPFTALAVDPEGQTAFTLTRTGWLKVYEYPTWKLRSTSKLNGIAYQAVLDARSARLYAVVFDPSTLTDRPRPRGFGDLHVYDVKALREPVK